MKWVGGVEKLSGFEYGWGGGVVHKNCHITCKKKKNLYLLKFCLYNVCQ
jgi:hypothetical protein